MTIGPDGPVRNGTRQLCGKRACHGAHPHQLAWFCSAVDMWRERLHLHIPRRVQRARLRQYGRQVGSLPFESHAPAITS